MKKKFLLILLTIVSALCLILGLSACDFGGGGGGTEQGGGGGNGDIVDNVGNKVSSGGLEFMLNEEKTGYCVTGVEDDAPADIVIPSKLNGLPVTSIGDSAFYKCSSLTSITIPNSVTEIGYQAFYYCSSLTSITIPDSVTSIGAGAFAYCSSLTSITIPDGVTSIGAGAFAYCSSLERIDVAADNPNYSIQDGILYNREKTEIICVPKAIKGAVTIGSGVTSIGYDAFSSCSSLERIDVAADNPNYSSQDGILYNKEKTEIICVPKAIKGAVTIPDGVTSIGNYAFKGCSSLTSINIPDGVTSIGNYAFWDCSSLTSINIPDGVTSIGEDAFNGCSSLTSIMIPQGVTSIGAGAFLDCSSLTSINIPDSVTEIGAGAFLDCSSLTSINIPDSVTSIGYSAFDGCSSLEKVYYGGTRTDWDVISIGSYNDSLTGATRYYYSATEPDEAKWAESENWWRFDAETGEVAEWKKEG